MIGSILLYANRLDEVSAILTPEMFYLDPHSKIYRVLLDMREQQIGIDESTLQSQLERRGMLTEVGGSEYLIQCVESIPHAAHAKFHANEVRDRWTQRTVIYACTDLLSQSYDGRYTGVELAAKAVAELSRIGEGINRGGRWYADIAMEAMERYHSVEPEGIKTGFADLDEQTGGLRPAELIIIAGRPSMGKTALAGNIAEYVAANTGTVAFFSLEMKDEALFDRTALKPCKTTKNSLRGKAIAHPDEIQEVVNDIGGLPIYVNDRASQSVSSITAECRTVKRSKGLSLVIVDYLQLIQPEDRKAPREQQVGQISWRLKELSKDLNVPVVCLSQLSRACEGRLDKKPTMADLRDSGQIEQNADGIWLPFRPAVYFPTQFKPEEVELIMPKNRGGQACSVDLKWDGPSMAFSSTNSGDDFNPGEHF